MSGFVRGAPRMNQLAERSDGFIWRLANETGPDAPDFGGDPLMIFTLSLWRDVESLRHFTWNTLHKKFRMRTAEWFEPHDGPYLVCWPIEAGRTPTGAEAQERLAELERTGPTDRVFGTETLSKEMV